MGFFSLHTEIVQCVLVQHKIQDMEIYRFGSERDEKSLISHPLTGFTEQHGARVLGGTHGMGFYPGNCLRKPAAQPGNPESVKVAALFAWRWGGLDHTYLTKGKLESFLTTIFALLRSKPHQIRYSL